jgi:hypothetical protein
MGTGDTKDMDKFAGKCSSLRWESTTEQKPLSKMGATKTINIVVLIITKTPAIFLLQLK